MLVEVLRSSTILRGKGSPWLLADELLKLFDELELSDQSPESLRNNIEGSELSHFSDDAKMVELLWAARKQQLEAEKTTDRPLQYRRGLSSLSHASQLDAPVLMLGYDWFHRAELTTIQHLLDSKNFHLFLSPHSPAAHQLTSPSHLSLPPLSATQTKASRFIGDCFQTNESLQSRAQLWKQQPSPLTGKVELLAAANQETEVQLIDLQVRQWLVEGINSIGVVTQDRRLARRLSAVLANAGVTSQDNAGWPLSTTIAAGILERWLECIEGDFPHRSFLDVIKSPFVKHPALNSQTAFHFERDIIDHEQVGRELSRYRTKLQERSARLTKRPSAYLNQLEALLNHVETAAAPLLQLKNKTSMAPKAFLEALESSLKMLSLWQGFQLDPAGQRITQEILDMRQSLEGRELTMSWLEFRGWLGRMLETHNFRPKNSTSQATLTDLSQGQENTYERLIIAGADAKQLPGAPARLIFFNDKIRENLRLPSWSTNRSILFSRFRDLLESTPLIVLSYSIEINGEPRLPSPWLARIQTLHKMAFGHTLPTPTVATFLGMQSSKTAPRHHRNHPQKRTMPTPAISPSLNPKTLSAGSHQKLIDCPYQFFAQYGLQLRANEEIIEQLTKADFGTKAHRCLEVYHSQTKSQPKEESENQGTLPQKHELLRRISAQVFDISPLNEIRERQWYAQWLEIIPHYIEWQALHEKNWRVFDTETELKKSLGEIATIGGKIDRIDKNCDSFSLIDYKTGASPKKAEQLAGEKVQLLTYALLLSNPSAIVFLPLTPKKLNPIVIEGEELTELLPDIDARLQELFQHLSTGGGLPANGSETTCQYCDVRGLCRKGVWA